MPLLIYLFGLPASGKSHAGQLLSKYFGFQFIDGDDYMPVDTQAALSSVHGSTPDHFFESIIKKFSAQIAINLAAPTPRDMVVSHRSFKNYHRENFSKRFPIASLWHVTAPDAVRAERLLVHKLSKTESEAARAGYYQDSSDSGFELPMHPCETLLNDGIGDTLLIERMRALLTSLRRKAVDARTQLTCGSVLTFSGIDSCDGNDRFWKSSECKVFLAPKGHLLGTVSYDNLPWKSPLGGIWSPDGMEFHMPFRVSQNHMPRIYQYSGKVLGRRFIGRWHLCIEPDNLENRGCFEYDIHGNGSPPVPREVPASIIEMTGYEVSITSRDLFGNIALVKTAIAYSRTSDCVCTFMGTVTFSSVLASDIASSLRIVGGRVDTNGVHTFRLSGDEDVGGDSLFLGVLCEDEAGAVQLLVKCVSGSHGRGVAGIESAGDVLELPEEGAALYFVCTKWGTSAKRVLHPSAWSPSWHGRCGVGARRRVETVLRCHYRQTLSGDRRTIPKHIWIQSVLSYLSGDAPVPSSRTCRVVLV